jgi:hypothetical protein
MDPLIELQDFAGSINAPASMRCLGAEDMDKDEYEKQEARDREIYTREYNSLINRIENELFHLSGPRTPWNVVLNGEDVIGTAEAELRIGHNKIKVWHKPESASWHVFKVVAIVPGRYERYWHVLSDTDPEARRSWDDETRVMEVVEEFPDLRHRHYPLKFVRCLLDLDLPEGMEEVWPRRLNGICRDYWNGARWTRIFSATQHRRIREPGLLQKEVLTRGIYGLYISEGPTKTETELIEVFQVNLGDQVQVDFIIPQLRKRVVSYVRAVANWDKLYGNKAKEDSRK